MRDVARAIVVVRAALARSAYFSQRRRLFSDSFVSEHPSGKKQRLSARFPSLPKAWVTVIALVAVF